MTYYERSISCHWQEGHVVISFGFPDRLEDLLLTITEAAVLANNIRDDLSALQTAKDLALPATSEICVCDMALSIPDAERVMDKLMSGINNMQAANRINSRINWRQEGL